MATYSTGVTVSFAGTAFSEIVGLNFDYGGGPSIGRGSVFNPVLGAVQLENLGGASSAVYGARGSLVISGGGLALTVTAICTSVGAVAEVNGLTRFSHTFDILG